jgi:toxin ParE1/3/4
MRRIFKTQEAESDFEDIWLYSFEQWNEAQADTYYDQLIEGINQLLDNPQLGKSQEKIRRGYRSIQIRHHIIYYQIQDDDIRIIRALHESMLPTKHL